jgi:hypothetical protein
MRAASWHGMIAAVLLLIELAGQNGGSEVGDLPPCIRKASCTLNRCGAYLFLVITGIKIHV